MKRILPIAGNARVAALLLGIALFDPPALFGQTNTGRASAPSHRYLFVVDTSRSMQARSGGTFRAVQDLLASSLATQARDGDTLGVWTFSDDLRTGRFALQQWSLEARPAIMSHVLQFLLLQPFTGKSNLKKVLPALEQVVKKSGRITVILISDGADQIQGTPFDKRINEAYHRWRKEQEKAQMPLITVLLASGGEIAAYSVTPAPSSVELPALVSSSNTDSTLQTNLVSALHQVLPSAGVFSNVQAERPPVPPPVSNVPPKPAPIPFSDISKYVTSRELPLDDEVATSAPPVEKVQAPQSAPTPLETQPLPPHPPRTAPATNSFITIIPPPNPVAPTNPILSHAASSNPPSAASSPAVVKPPPPPPVVGSATAAGAPAAFFNRPAFWIGVLALIAVGAGAAWLWMRRTRGISRGSLITRSLERERNQRRG